MSQGFNMSGIDQQEFMCAVSVIGKHRYRKEIEEGIVSEIEVSNVAIKNAFQVFEDLFSMQYEDVRADKHLTIDFEQKSYKPLN